MTEFALQLNGIWKTDLKSRVVRSVYYDEKSHLLAVELRHGKIRLYSEAPKDMVLALANHRAPGLFYELAPEGTFGKPLSRLRPKGASFLRRMKPLRGQRGILVSAAGVSG
ncbi:KTSC domain-containing protein [Neorhizobium sp. P12A]|uniref:KTSC domain-containing protein n=1 Tax=Neorhizobium sp. P12A TaxID=2268027 RepID=UPI0011EECBFA|nr:KTSC domain-containing protein [Neorhizobium sp. P12A]KAA0691457.1 KTSC domain-containing protein [Neorhizobium sp. P12A]